MSQDSKSSNPKPSLEQRAVTAWEVAEKARRKHGSWLCACETQQECEDAKRSGPIAAILAFAQSVAAESAPRWVPVGERLPEGLPRLVLAVEFGRVRIRNTVEIRELHNIVGITHWHEMPKVPHD